MDVCRRGGAADPFPSRDGPHIHVIIMCGKEKDAKVGIVTEQGPKE